MWAGDVGISAVVVVYKAVLTQMTQVSLNEGRPKEPPSISARAEKL